MQKLLDHLTNLGLGALAPVVGTVIVLVIGLLLVKAVVKIAAKAFEKNNRLDPSVEKLLLVVIRVGGCAVLALICAEMLSIPTASLITLLGTLGLALSLSLQSTVENIASGIFIITPLNQIISINPIRRTSPAAAASSSVRSGKARN